MNYFCTFFDQRYITRGLALVRSLSETTTTNHLWILCMDQPTADCLSRLCGPAVTLLSIEEIAVRDERILAARQDRTLVEFYFTSKAFLCDYILATNQQVDLLTYLDADMYFFGDPSLIRDQMQGYSIGITPHRFPLHLRSSEKYGRYNAGFVSIRRDQEGLACLAWWQDACFAWCHDYIDNDRFADQRYLDRIPERYERVNSIAHRGINCAPWNLAGCTVEHDDRTVRVDGQELILYHFHSLKKKNTVRYDSGFSLYKTTLTRPVREHIYKPYLAVIEREEARLPALPGVKQEIRVPATRYPAPGWFSFAVRTLLLRMLNAARVVIYRSSIRWSSDPSADHVARHARSIQ